LLTCIENTDQKSRAARRAGAASYDGYFASCGLVVTGALGVAQFLGKNVLRGEDDEAGDLETRLVKHLSVFEFDSLQRLGDQLVGTDGGVLLLLVEELLGSLARFFDEPGALKLGLLDDGGAFLLGLCEQGLRFLGIPKARLDLPLAVLHGGEHRLEGEPPEEDRHDGKTQDLREEEGQIDAEIRQELRHRRGFLAFFGGGKEQQVREHGGKKPRRAFEHAARETGQ